jgi:hypothetical protein
MSGTDKRSAYLLISVNTDALPMQIPVWLMRFVDVMAEIRAAIVETEQAVSVVVNGTDDERSKAGRCANLLTTFAAEHHGRMKAIADEFKASKGGLAPDIANSFGTDLTTLVLACANLSFRGDMLWKVIANSQEWRAGESIAFHCLSESCKGQGMMLDWLARSFSPPIPQATEPEA